jgi:hypothetical protein
VGLEASHIPSQSGRIRLLVAGFAPPATALGPESIDPTSPLSGPTWGVYLVGSRPDQSHIAFDPACIGVGRFCVGRSRKDFVNGRNGFGSGRFHIGRDRKDFVNDRNSFAVGRLRIGGVGDNFVNDRNSFAVGRARIGPGRKDFVNGRNSFALGRLPIGRGLNHFVNG